MIRDDIRKDYVGEIWEGFEIWTDDPSLNATFPRVRITSYSELPVTWRGHTYTPFPVELVNVSSEMDRAPPRPTLQLSNVDNAIFPFVGLFDRVGFRVRRWRTLGKYLDGGSNPDPNQHFPVVTYTILSRSVAKDIMTYQLGVINDQPQAKLPRRVVLRQPDIPNTLYAPAVGLAGARSR